MPFSLSKVSFFPLSLGAAGGGGEGGGGGGGRKEGKGILLTMVVMEQFGLQALVEVAMQERRGV